MVKDKTSFIPISREISPTAFLKLWVLHKCKIVQVWPLGERLDVIAQLTLSPKSLRKVFFSLKQRIWREARRLWGRRRCIQATPLPPTTDDCWNFLTLNSWRKWWYCPCPPQGIIFGLEEVLGKPLIPLWAVHQHHVNSEGNDQGNVTDQKKKTKPNQTLKCSP